MSGNFIVLYAGMPVKLPSLGLVPADEAMPFVSEADAWYAVYQTNLAPLHFKVIPLADALNLDAHHQDTKTPRHQDEN